MSLHLSLYLSVGYAEGRQLPRPPGLSREQASRQAAQQCALQLAPPYWLVPLARTVCTQLRCLSLSFMLCSAPVRRWEPLFGDG